MMDDLESELYNIEEVYCTPEVVEDEETETCNLSNIASLPPDKSKHRYEYMYSCFDAWKKENHLGDSFSEDIILMYFRDLSKKKSPSTLWCTYSMLKVMIKFKNNIDIGQYKELLAFLKNRSKGYIAVTAPTFTEEQINRFMDEAPDSEYLVTKVVLIFGLLGSLSTDELTYLKLHNVESHGQVFLVKIPKLDQPSIIRSFAITGKYFDIVDKYVKLRPSNVTTDRFFLSYRKQKCTVQVIGRNKIGAIPREVATYLGLENAHLFTGHSLRKTSLTKSGTDRRSARKHKLSSITTYSNKKPEREDRSKESCVNQPSTGQNIDEDNSSVASCGHSNDSDAVSSRLLADSSTSPVNGTDGTVIRDEEEVVLNFPMSELCQSEHEDVTNKSTDDTRKLRDRRLDLVNKYFTFRNCSNVYINFE